MCQEAGRAVLIAAYSVAFVAHVCVVYVNLLLGVAWSVQLAGSWVILHIWLYSALLETLRLSLLILLCEQATRGLVQAVVPGGRGLAWVQGVETFVQLCATHSSWAPTHAFLLCCCQL